MSNVSCFGVTCFLWFQNICMFIFDKMFSVMITVCNITSRKVCGTIIVHRKVTK